MNTAVEPIVTRSSGSKAFDQALGGGYPRGRLVEVLGEPASKVALAALVQVQQAGGVAALIDMAHEFHPPAAQAMGLKLEELLVSQPDDGAQALQIVETLARSGAVDLIVIDSVATMFPQRTLDDERLGFEARLMSQAMRTLTASASRSGTTILFVNSTPSVNGTGPGGNALKFYTSQRVDVRRIPGAFGPAGVGVRAKVVKNKLAAPFQEAVFIIAADGLKDVADQAGFLDLARRQLEDIQALAE